MTEKLTTEEIIEYLNKCNDREASVVVVWKVTEQKPYIVTVGDIVDIINRQHAEIDDARIGVKSYKGKYASAVKIARKLQTLVDEQQAEIERLQNDLAISRKETKRYATRRAEAIKEFAERLKERLKGNGGLYCVTTMNAKIDILVKEMVGK
jgi:hypothetical protein